MKTRQNKPAANYFFDGFFYDPNIEYQNIADSEIEEVTVFTKNSIKIPVADGDTCSPDFAYIVKTPTGEVLNFVIEAKGVAESNDLRKGEARKIKHAETLFAKISENIKVVFKTQFEEDKIAELIRQNM